MKWKTTLSTIKDGKEIIRGFELGELIKNKSFVETIFLLWTGREATGSEKNMMEALFTACIDHGIGAPSATVARTVASAGNSMHTALAAGIATLGDLHGGAIENAAIFFKDNENTKDVSKLVSEVLEKKILIPGYGHKVLQHDGRADALFEVAKKNNYYLKHCVLAEKVGEELNKISGKNLPLNIDGAMAAIILDMGFDSKMAKGFFMAGRVPGLVAHIFEEQNSGEGLRRVAEEEIGYVGD